MDRLCAAAALALAATLLVASCGGPGTESSAIHSPLSAVGDSQAAAHNDADVTFARNMIPHHQQGVMLAAMVPDHTANPALTVIAAHIRADQQAEIVTLNTLLAQWREPATADAGTHDAHHSMPMIGMVDERTLDELRSLRVAAFDVLWTKAMIGHHQGAIAMAQTEIANGLSPDAMHVVRLIVDAQQREISSMNHLISDYQ